MKHLQVILPITLSLSFFISSCDIGRHIIGDDYLAERLLTRKHGIWKLDGTETYTIMVDGSMQNYQYNTLENIYWQFLYQSEMVFGTPLESLKTNIVGTNSEGIIQNFEWFYTIIEDVRITLTISGNLGDVSVFNIIHLDKETMEITQINRSTFEKTTWYFTYCPDCTPADFDIENDEI